MPAAVRVDEREDSDAHDGRLRQGRFEGRRVQTRTQRQGEHRRGIQDDALSLQVDRDDDDDDGGGGDHEDGDVLSALWLLWLSW